MKQFKFRAYDKKNKEWLLGYDYGDLGGFSMFGETVLMGDWGAVVISDMRGDVDVVLNQFTGLKDRNGVEIYEGDIVYLAGYGDYKVDFPFIQLYDSSFEGDIGTIKGNIYENSELLNQITEEN